MKAPLEARIGSNLLLAVDHCLQQAGQAFVNYSGLLYPVNSDLQGYTAYATPFKQICNDTSVSGAQVLSGVYINGVYTPVGSGHFKLFNPYKGVAYFDINYPNNTVISGVYGIKNFSVEIADQPEWKLMFETEYTPVNKYNQTLSGLDPSVKTSPIVYLTFKNATRTPFGFGHVNENKIEVRAVIIGSNEFETLTARSVLMDLYQKFLPMPQATGLPFDAAGNNTGIIYNYKNLPQDTTYSVWIADARAIDVPQKGDYQDMAYRNIAVVDFTLSTVIQGTFTLP